MKGGDVYETVIEDIDDVEGDIEAIEPSHVDMEEIEEEQELDVSDAEIIAVENEKLSFTLADLVKGNEEFLFAGLQASFLNIGPMCNCVASACRRMHPQLLSSPHYERNR